MDAERWNALYPPGTRVVAYPGCRPDQGATGEHCCPVLDTVTDSRAWTLGHGEPVVRVAGHGAGISLEFVDVVPTVVEGAGG